MRILKTRIDRGCGFVHLIPTDDEDLWHIYNLITVGDIIQAMTLRKIINETYTGS